MRAFCVLLALVALGLPAAQAQDAAPYGGPLFDTHAHQDDESFAGRLVPSMQGHQVDRAILFVPMDPDDPADSHEILRESLAGFPGRFVLFFHVDPQTPQDIRSERLERVRAFAPGDFKGFGETALYRAPWLDQAFDEDPWPDALSWVGGNDLVAMVHLRMGQQEELARMLQAHPDTTILLHGSEFRRELPALLTEHQNLWFTLDTASLLTYQEPPIPLMYPMQGGRDEFIADFDANRQRMLDKALLEWTPVIAAAPDRVFWGTDASLDWHADPAVYDRLVGFSRDFIAGLPQDLQAPYAWSNADREFGTGAVLEPADDEPDGVPGLGPLPVVGVVALLAWSWRRRWRQPSNADPRWEPR